MNEKYRRDSNYFALSWILSALDASIFKIECPAEVIFQAEE